MADAFPRVGLGFDVHRLEAGDFLKLGGVNIPSHVRAVGHSDADVLVHAICDALLGSLALRDIGHHFPDTDPQYKGINSLVLLEKVCELLSQKGYIPSNIDATVTLEKPKLNPHIPEMQKTLAKSIRIQPEQISVKATTNEKLGYTGNETGIEARAIAMVVPVK